MRRIDADYMPTLRAFAKNTTTFKIVSLDDLEAPMLKKFKGLWPYEVELTSKSLLLTFPRQTPEALVEKAVNALKKWYRNHFVQLEQVTKRGGKLVRVTLVKRLVD